MLKSPESHHAAMVVTGGAMPFLPMPSEGWVRFVGRGGLP
jgi:hypothetical protein